MTFLSLVEWITTGKTVKVGASLRRMGRPPHLRADEISIPNV
jgi:hypothetical protein